MRIVRVDLRVEDAPGAVGALAALLDAAVVAGGTAVRVGWTDVVPVDRGASTGVDHLAVLVPADAFAQARAWTVARTPLLDRDGTTDFEGPAGWDSTSVYFDGPGGSILELIAHREGPPGPAGVFGSADLLGVCEAGVGVDDVPAAVATLAAAGLRPFAGSAGEDFAAVGDLEGKVILASTGRPWLPTRDRVAGPAPLRIETDEGPVDLPVGAALLTRHVRA